MSKRHHTKLVHEGQYVAEVDVELIDVDEKEGGWGPYLSPEDAEKLDQVRQALRRGNLKQAAKLGRIFSLTPIET